MKAPKKIKIGPNTVIVKSVNPDELDGKYADFSPRYQSIRVSTDMSKGQTALSLLHEVLHACFFDAGLPVRFNPDDEEIIIRVLEARIGAMIKDNPKFITYIQESLKDA